MAGWMTGLMAGYGWMDWWNTGRLPRYVVLVPEGNLYILAASRHYL